MSDLFKYNSDFWKELEVQIKGDIPEIVKHILRATGYENRLNLYNITKDDFVEIESYINKNLKVWFRKLQKIDDNYANLKKFELLPGHKKIILKISEDLQKLKTVLDTDNSSKLNESEAMFHDKPQHVLNSLLPGNVSCVS